MNKINKKRLDELFLNNQFKMYYEFLVSENEKYNLTSITDKDEVYIKHFYDSIQLENIINFEKKIDMCDVGSGAGFPSIPLKILYPNINLTIIEPTLKRCNFLKELCDRLKLDNITIINDRAENIKDLKFDIVTARAVSNLPILLELCIPLTKVNSYFIAYKGSNYNDEINLSKNALKELSSTITLIYNYSLDDNDDVYGNHTLVKVLKEKETKKIYPRMYSQIKKKPL